MSEFSEFIRNASPEEREKTLLKVIDQANYDQAMSALMVLVKENQTLTTEISNWKHELSRALIEWKAWMESVEDGDYDRPADDDWDDWHRLDKKLSAAVSGSLKHG